MPQHVARRPRWSAAIRSPTGSSTGRMLSKGVPRVRMQAMWRVPEAFLEQAQDDATIVAIRDMERAGIDIISDGEIRRESYSNRFATALDGVDVDAARGDHGPLRQPDPGAARGRAGSGGRGPSSCATCSSSAATRTAPPRSPCPAPSPWPSRRRTSSTATSEELAMDFAAAVNAEARELAGRRRRRHPARRALAPQRSRGGQALRGARDQPRARRPHRADRAAPLLRLRGGGAAPEAHRLLVPAAARGDHRAADLDRGRAAQARPGRARRARGQDHHPRA